MPNEFDTLAAEFAADALTDTFAERTEHGKFAEVELTPPGREPVKLVGVIVGKLAQRDEIETTLGTHKRDEIEQEVELTIPRSQPSSTYMPSDGDRFSLSKYGEPDEPFTLQEVTDLTDTFATVRVTRRIATRIQRGSVERD